jgi:hypothetical protein
VTRAMADNDGFPKTCCICSRPVVKARDGALRFHMDDVTGLASSWHVEPCEREHGWPLKGSREEVVARGGVD